MNYISVKEIAKRWGLTQRRVQGMCREGLINGVIREGKKFKIPTEAEKPLDNRIKTGKYIGFRDKLGKVKTKDN